MKCFSPRMQVLMMFKVVLIKMLKTNKITKSCIKEAELCEGSECYIMVKREVW